MWVNKKEYTRLKERVTELEGRKKVTKFESCEKCGCLLSDPIKGGGVIKQKPECRGAGFGVGYVVSVDYIYYPHYCKIHAPKKREPAK